MDYFKIKVMELLVFLGALELVDYRDERPAIDMNSMDLTLPEPTMDYYTLCELHYGRTG